MPTAYDLTYYPWITQHADPGDIRQAINSFASAVEKAGDCKITVLKPISVPDQIDWIGKGERRIALMNPLGFVLAKTVVSAIEAVSVALRQQIEVGPDGDAHGTDKLVPQYRAQLYANVKSAIRKTSDDKFLRQVRRPAGASIAFGTSYSTSNFLVPAWMLRTRLNVSALTAFSSVSFLGGHDTVAKAVYDGRVDLGAGHDGAIEDLAQQPGYGDAEHRLVPLYWTDEIASDPVVANIDDTKERDALGAAIVAASKTAEGSAALKTFWGGVPQLARQTSAAYDAIGRCVTDLGLREVDLLGP